MTAKNLLGKKRITQPKPCTGDWFYMHSDIISMETVKTILEKEINIMIEYWTDADILEVELSDKTSIDFEPVKVFFKDANGAAFLKEHEISSLYAVTFLPQYYEEVSEILSKIVQHCGGFFCADTEQFMPRIDA